MNPTRKDTWLKKTSRNAKFAALIRSAGLESAVSQEELGRRMSKPQSFISSLETGKIHLTLADFEDFALGIKIDPATLLARLYPDTDNVPGRKARSGNPTPE